MKKDEDKESTASEDGSKVKEEKLKVAGEKCWRGKWQNVLELTGEIFNRFPMKVTLATVNMLFPIQNGNISQKLGSCLLLSSSLRGSTQSLPWSSTTMMADFKSKELLTFLTEYLESYV